MIRLFSAPARTRFILAGACTLLLIGTVLGADDAATPETPIAAPHTVIDLPQMGEPADLAMSPAQERALGAQVVAELYANNYVLEDPEVEEYISNIGWKLVSASLTKPPHVAFYPIADERINAFALPGGYIGVNAGILLSAANESELAGVMGHELAHVTQRHIARSQEGETAASIATWAAVLAAILAGSGNPDVIIGALSLGQSVTYQRQVNYTRANEQEADRFGIQTMAAAGFDPQGMASFFTRLSQESRLYGNGLPEILRTHPLNTARVAEAQARIAALPKSNYKDSPDFAIIKARTRVLAADNASEAVEYFANIRETSVAARYGYAFALSLRGQYDDAIAALQPALEQMPRQVNLNLLMSKLEGGLHQTEQQLATLDRTLRMYPGYP
ncbi:MAG TPA: M48 family metalloprotease, partial [Nevskiaceae bacterium]|nr:M48 family metalloprotease [Nevskiaceae bacterium]